MRLQTGKNSQYLCLNDLYAILYIFHADSHTPPQLHLLFVYMDNTYCKIHLAKDVMFVSHPKYTYWCFGTEETFICMFMSVCVCV